MPMHYDKLVRDRIPEIIRAEGRSCEVEVMDEAAYRAALRAKVLEEAQEVADAPEGELAKEVADLFEVLESLCTAYDVPIDDVRALQQQRRVERGGFEKRLRLLGTW